MKRLLVIGAFLIGFVFGDRADACTMWEKNGTSSPLFSDVGSACAVYNQGPSGTTTITTDSGSAPSGASGPGIVTQCFGTITTTVNGSTASQANQFFGSVQGVTGTSAQCSTSCGIAAGSVVDVGLPGSAALAAGVTQCGADGCTYTMGPASSMRSWLASSGSKQVVTQTAVSQGGTTSCVAASPAPQPLSVVDAGTNVQDCTSLGSVISCTVQNPTTGAYCGTYNGDEVCVGAVPANKCVAFASGGVACTVPSGASAQAPPAPDNGTAGVPAAPTATLANNVSGAITSTNYYSAATAAASTKGGVASGVGPTGTVVGGAVGTSGSGTGGAGVTGNCPPGQTCTGTTDGVSGGADCTAPPVCTDSDPVQCGQVKQTWYLMCINGTEAQVASAIGTVETIGSATPVDLSTAVSETGALPTGGTCPAPLSVTVAGHSFEMDLFGKSCLALGWLGFAILAVAYMVGAKIIFGAVGHEFNQRDRVGLCRGIFDSWPRWGWRPFKNIARQSR
jgi:hypothetical protein